MIFSVAQIKSGRSGAQNWSCWVAWTTRSSRGFSGEGGGEQHVWWRISLHLPAFHHWRKNQGRLRSHNLVIFHLDFRPVLTWTHEH